MVLEDGTIWRFWLGFLQNRWRFQRMDTVFNKSCRAMRLSNLATCSRDAVLASVSHSASQLDAKA